MDHHVVTGAAGVPGWFAAYPLILVGAWCAALKIISRLSGWSALAETFGFPGMFEGKVYRFQSARMGPVNLNLALNLGADESGLYLVPVFFFRLFHPPLLIPWSEIEAAPVKRFPGLRWFRLTFPSLPGARLELPARTFEKLAPPRLLESFTPVKSTGHRA